MTEQDNGPLPLTEPEKTEKPEAAGAVTHIFDRPFHFEGQEISELKLDLESLTGRDISKVKSVWAAAGNFSPMAAADMEFCIMVACKAAGQPFEMAETLPAKEYVKLSQVVSNFLLS